MKQVSPERQNAFNFGTALMVVGVLLIIVGFISFALLGVRATKTFGQSTSPLVGFFTFFAGMIVAAIGQGIRGVAARGVAGSGLVLDPEQARKDVEPWSRMAGGVVKDALDETGLLEKQGTESEDFDTRLRKLHQLHADGVITQAEYEKAKARVLERQL